jgi:hypothetical protein
MKGNFMTLVAKYKQAVAAVCLAVPLAVLNTQVAASEVAEKDVVQGDMDFSLGMWLQLDISAGNELDYLLSRRASLLDEEAQAESRAQLQRWGGVEPEPLDLEAWSEDFRMAQEHAQYIGGRMMDCMSLKLGHKDAVRRGDHEIVLVTRRDFYQDYDF